MVPGVLRQVIPLRIARPDRGRTWTSNPLGISIAKPVATACRAPGCSVTASADEAEPEVAAIPAVEILAGGPIIPAPDHFQQRSADEPLGLGAIELGEDDSSEGSV